MNIQPSPGSCGGRGSARPGVAVVGAGIVGAATAYALSREGCQDLVNAIYLHVEANRVQEHRATETQMAEEARGIVSIDPDDPRFKIID